MILGISWCYRKSSKRFLYSYYVLKRLWGYTGVKDKYDSCPLDGKEKFLNY
jgi:hypothetical protein